MKAIPNVLSLVRLILSLILICFFSNHAVFIILYLLAGFTDFLDGFLARKLNAESEFGARIDSIADTFFYLILCLFLISEFREILSGYFLMILIIFTIRLINILLGLYKYKKLVMLHTIGNKLAGFLIFTIPLLLISNLTELLIWIVGIAALAAIEEFFILISSPRNSIDLNKKSLFL